MVTKSARKPTRAPNDISLGPTPIFLLTRTSTYGHRNKAFTLTEAGRLVFDAEPAIAQEIGTPPTAPLVFDRFWRLDGGWIAGERDDGRATFRAHPNSRLASALVARGLVQPAIERDAPVHHRAVLGGGKNGLGR